jgi:HlyD family secretion protein
LENNPEETIAKEQLAAATRLLALGSVSDDQLKTAQRAVDAVQKRLKIAEFDRKKYEADYKVGMDNLRLQRDKMMIPAPPIDGQVDTPLTWEGALIGDRQTVAIVYSNARIVSAKISEESFGKLKLGQKAKLRLLAYGGKEFDATVSKLLRRADDAQRFEVWLDVKVDPELLLPGSTGEVTITVDERTNQLVIPRRALIDASSVYVVKNGVVRRRTVKVGYMALNVVEVREGLEEGEHVVVDLLDEFRDGERVNIQIVK